MPEKTTLDTLKKWWWFAGIIFVNIPVLIAVLSIAGAIIADPEFFTELFTEVLTRENVERVNEALIKVDYLWAEAGGEVE